MIAETQGRGPLALGQVAVELHLSAQGDTGAELPGLAPLGVADRLGQGEDFPGAAEPRLPLLGPARSCAL